MNFPLLLAIILMEAEKLFLIDLSFLVYISVNEINKMKLANLCFVLKKTDLAVPGLKKLFKKN